MKSGQDYKDLKNSYVIFICIPDIFGKGLPVYTFENLCRQDTSIPLGDRTLKYFFISDNCDKLLNEEQKAFMRLVSGCSSSNAFTDRVAHLTEDAKRNSEYRRQYMEWERQKAYEYKRGKAEKAVETARNLLNLKLGTIEQIAQAVSLPLETVQQLAEELTTVNS